MPANKPVKREPGAACDPIVPETAFAHQMGWPDAGRLEGVGARA